MTTCGTLVVEADDGDGGGDGGDGGGGAGAGIGQWVSENPRLAAGIGVVGGLAAYSVLRGDTPEPTLPSARQLARPPQ